VKKTAPPWHPPLTENSSIQEQIEMVVEVIKLYDASNSQYRTLSSGFLHEIPMLEAEDPFGATLSGPNLLT
jgi:hypothetical protein